MCRLIKHLRKQFSITAAAPIHSKSPSGGIEFLTVARAVSEQFLFRHPGHVEYSGPRGWDFSLFCKCQWQASIFICVRQMNRTYCHRHTFGTFSMVLHASSCDTFNADNGFVRSKTPPPPSIHPSSALTLSLLSCCEVMVVWFPHCFTSPPSPPTRVSAPEITLHHFYVGQMCCSHIDW